MNAITYVPAGPGIVDAHSSGRETMAGVANGTDGLIILEIEETKIGNTAREYAEVALSATGARLLRDLLTVAIIHAGAHA